MKFHISGEIRCLSNKIRRKVDNMNAIVKLDELSGTNGFIIGYIEASKRPVYQKDIEKEFGITRSTASKVISLMEKKGLIERRSVKNDARLKEIILTSKALELNQDVIVEIDHLDEKLMKGFSEEEINLFSSYLKRITDNLNLGDDCND